MDSKTPDGFLQLDRQLAELGQMARCFFNACKLLLGGCGNGSTIARVVAITLPNTV
ncbi:hypothetical protein [Paenibacillus caui]|uniref:hypothetical protein n=1 Tax=Paenibacillus caui TaxID=2873927 RepID=UPI001CA7EBA8|nr:hypothetical protein [Paenibacillus caui]